MGRRLAWSDALKPWGACQALLEESGQGFTAAHRNEASVEGGCSRWSQARVRGHAETGTRDIVAVDDIQAAAHMIIASR